MQKVFFRPRYAEKTTFQGLNLYSWVKGALVFDKRVIWYAKTVVWKVRDGFRGLNVCLHEFSATTTNRASQNVLIQTNTRLSNWLEEPA